MQPFKIIPKLIEGEEPCKMKISGTPIEFNELFVGIEYTVKCFGEIIEVKCFLFHSLDSWQSRESLKSTTVPKIEFSIKKQNNGIMVYGSMIKNNIDLQNDFSTDYDDIINITKEVYQAFNFTTL